MAVLEEVIWRNFKDCKKTSRFPKAPSHIMRYIKYMKREIKFRVWLDNKMYLGEPNYIWDMKTKDDPVMQFTGLKDKNGNEIYEGDIVEFNWEDNASAFDKHGKGRSVVEWSEGGFYFSGQYGYEGLEIYFKETEIIGNIYENPELLK